MIISHRYGFIFVKTKKTAGTSIEVFLSPRCGEQDVVTPIWPHVDGHTPRNHKGIWNPLRELAGSRGRARMRALHDLARMNRFYNHIPARTIRWRVPTEVWNGYFKFCVERNPWDKTLSHYHMTNDRAGGEMSFEAYLAKGSYCINHPRYTDDDGNIIVDRIIKYETLSEELSEVFGSLGIPFEGSLGVRAKSTSRKDPRPYQEVLSDGERKTIEEAFAREVKLHGYRF